MAEDNRNAPSRRHMLALMTAAGAALPLTTAPSALALSGPATRAGGLAPTALQVNSRTQPLGTQTAPAFSWIPPVKRQSAYEIRVGTRPGGSDVWASGRVKGSLSTEAPYDGPRLHS